jgi:hypothetical protein
MMDNKNTVTESLEETAACEALGANTAAESAAYQKTLAEDQTGAAAKLDRQLRETSARLAAASPHLTPSPDLRARLLQATAPKTFRMEDYRKATREDSRFYKWGFYAAAAFLVMASLYNLSVGRNLETANKNILALQGQLNQAAAINQESNNAVAAFIDPRSVSLTWNENGKPFGRGLVNLATHQALLIFPQELVQPGTRMQISMNVNGKKVDFKTTTIVAPAKDVALQLPSDKVNFDMKAPEVENGKAAPPTKIEFAGLSPMPK